MLRTRTTGARRVPTVIAAAAAAALLTLTGCSGPQPGGGAAEATGQEQFTQADIDAALQEPTELTFWAWGAQYPSVVEAFNAAHPDVKVTLASQGSGSDHYTKLQNVLKAGSGVPDVVQLEYSVMPQFALGESLVDLGQYGVDSMQADFSESCWQGSKVDDALYGLPQDAGPLAMFYRQDVFDQFGLTVPTTWDEYVQTAQQLKAADPSRFIAADAGDPGAASALIWQAGGRPFQVEGERVSVDLADPGSTTWADNWQRLIDGDLVDTATPGFTPEWNAGLASGKYATLVTGAWAAGTLQRRIPDAAGAWRVAPLPQYGSGTAVSGQTGGSVSSVMATSEKKLAAIGFVQWMAANAESAQIWVDEGGFPCTSATLASPEWLDREVPYFGGQQINRIFAESAEQVGEGWAFLPFQAYANSVFPDTVGQAYVKQTDLQGGLRDWQETITTYGESQGFTVE
ncbi:extracellular solute-binding protein [Kineococcus sp. R8]|uniref:ABC transporter substrate-binding protein n=1 Tax=Kineococcus siccus TaxID=2696567 RepID=UPI001412966B|nr:extracellular solute-binding protein [Kineococcus siccus]NAZ81941.1 extracellular solute-binding protein [Kineococcus siccus]